MRRTLVVACVLVVVSLVVGTAAGTSPAGTDSGSAPEALTASEGAVDDQLNVTLRKQDGDVYTATGDLRESTLSTLPNLFLNETLRVELRIVNEGERTGSYQVPLVVDDEAVDKVSGTLAPGEEVIEPLEVRFSSPGTFHIAVADHTDLVRVHESGAALVDEVRVDNETVDPGEEVQIEATVVSDHAPSERTVEFEVDFEVIDAVHLSLAPEEVVTVETSYVPPESGVYTVTVGEGWALISAVPEPPEDVPGVNGSVSEDPNVPGVNENDSESEDSLGPGFGVQTVLVALLAVLIAASRRVGSEP
jgi:hypothetical protein